MEATEHAATQFVEATFLSPRVVDGALLGEFAESLRGLLGTAASQREQLLAAVTRGEAIAQSLADTAAKAGETLRPAIKLIPTIDQKLAHADEALARAGEAAAAGEAARAANEEGAAALRHARLAFDTALERARELEARLGNLTERAQSAIGALDTECRSRLDTAARHAQDVLGTMVAELDARAEEAIGRLTALLNDRRAAAEAAVGEAVEFGGSHADGTAVAPRVEAVPAAEAADETADGSAALRTATAAAAAACADVEALIESIRSRTESMAGALEARAGRAVRQVGEAARRAEEVERAAGVAEARLQAAEEQLRLIDERGREIATGASQALAAFDAELTGRMHTIREMMEQLASVTDRHESTGGSGSEPRPTTAPATAPDAEIQPTNEAARFIRIDRPAGESEPGGGLPGRLRF